ncbi:MAG: winged helix-turn-helix transcriptional regulator [Theionarchaea archaeon]|nr:winged helix-turn-helix transcriptional regulator [Theionarchaea archaeon]
MQIKDEILEILGKKGTISILEFLNQHHKVQYSQMKQFADTHTLNTRTRELLKYGLVEHHLEREITRREWYEITEKGRDILQCMQELLEPVKTFIKQGERDDKIDETRERKVIALLGSKDTKEILQYLRQQGEVQYTDFDLSISLPTLNTRLRKLLKFGLIEHCIAKQPKRREWYEITERGKNVLKIMEDMGLTKK